MELEYQAPPSNDNIASAVEAATAPGMTVLPSYQTQAQQHVLGLVVPGRATRTDFIPVDPTGTKFALTLTSPGDLPSPLTLVNEIVCYLESPLPAGHGLSIFWQLASQQEQSGFELLGSLTPDRPSEIFRTGWSEHDQFLAMPPQQPATITIGISIEPMDNIRNLSQANYLASSSTTSSSAVARRPLVAQKIAQDLYNFMQSFDTTDATSNMMMTTNGGSSQQQMVVPKNIFERWWKRFEAKSKRDPNFFLKTGD